MLQMGALHQLRVDGKGWSLMELAAQQHFGMPLTPRPTAPVISRVEHIARAWIEHPVAAFAVLRRRILDATTARRRGRGLLPWHFYEAVV